MATKKSEHKAATALHVAVKSEPMQDVTPSAEDSKAPAKQDNKPVKATAGEVLDASSTKAGQFPQPAGNIFEALYSRQKVIEEVSKPYNAQELETSIDKLYTKLTYDLPTEIKILTCRVVLAAIQHGNVWPARKLMQAMGAQPKGASKTMFRVVNLRNWFEAKGPFKWTDVGDMINYATGEKVESSKGLTIDGNRKREMLGKLNKDSAGFIKDLAEVPFWVFQPVTEAQLAKFDFRKELGKLLDRAAKMETRQSEHKPGDDIKLDGLAKVRALLPQLNSGQQTFDPSEKGQNQGA